MFLKTNVPDSNSKTGYPYDIPKYMSEDDFYRDLEELKNFIKAKGLTVRQALILLETCKEYIVDGTLV